MRKSNSSKISLFISILLMVCMINVDFTSLSLAIPSLIYSFNSTLFSAQWIITSYFIAAGCTFILGGFLSDRYGAQVIYSKGLLLFAVGSFVSSIANNILLIIFGRVLQGLGFALSFNTGILLIKHAFNMKQRGFALSIIITAASLSQAIGPFLGGIIIQYLNWRWIFIINLPISLIALMLFRPVLKQLTLDPHPDEKIIEASESQLRIMNISFLLSCIIRCIYNFCWISLLFIMPIYLINILNISPIKSGMTLLLISGIAAIISPLIGKYNDKKGSEIFILAGLFILLVANTLSVMVYGESFYIFLCIMYGLGTAFILPALTKYALENLPKRSEGIGMGIFYTCSLISSSFAIPITSLLLTKFSLYQLSSNPSFKDEVINTLLKYATGTNSLLRIPTEYHAYAYRIKGYFLNSLKGVFLLQAILLITVFLLFFYRYIREYSASNNPCRSNYN